MIIFIIENILCYEKMFSIINLLPYIVKYRKELKMRKEKIITIICFVVISIIFIQNIFSGEIPLNGQNWDDSLQWKTLDDQKSMVTIEDTKGKNDNALKIVYKIKGDGGWVLISKNIQKMPSQDTPILFDMKANANSILEIKMIDKDGSTFGIKRSLNNNFKDWTQIIVFSDELDYWWGGDEKFDEPKEFHIAISGSGKGTVFIDEIGYGYPQERTEEAIILGNWDNISLWQSLDDGISTIKFEQIKGKVDKGLQIKYNLKKENGFVQITKRLSVSLTEEIPLTFYIKADSKAVLEIKLVDKDGSNFGTKTSLKKRYTNWAPFVVYFDELDYWWGGDENFDEPKEIYIAISGPKGAGLVQFDEIGYGTIEIEE